MTEAPAPLTDKDTARLMKEWETARDLLAKFDERINELRHWGFGFITVLLTAEGLLLPGPGPIANTPVIPDIMKLTIVAVTLLLILALRLTERNLVLYQQGAALRGKTIERLVGLDLTGVLSDINVLDRMVYATTAQYSLLVIATGAVGFFAIQQGLDGPYRGIALLDLVVTLIALVGLLSIEPYLRINAHGYWSTDRVTVEKGSKLRISFTNISRHKLKFTNKAPYKIRRVGDDSQGKDVGGKAGTVLRRGEYYDWIWNTAKDGVEPGVYKLEFTHPLALFTEEGITKRQALIERFLRTRSKQHRARGRVFATITVIETTRPMITGRASSPLE